MSGFFCKRIFSEFVVVSLYVVIVELWFEVIDILIYIFFKFEFYLLLCCYIFDVKICDIIVDFVWLYE